MKENVKSRIIFLKRFTSLKTEDVGGVGNFAVMKQKWRDMTSLKRNFLKTFQTDFAHSFFSKYVQLMYNKVL